jgi:hypothetical protein
VFSVGLEYFFSDDQKRHVLAIVRRAQRKPFPERPNGRDISFYFESLDFAAAERKLKPITPSSNLSSLARLACTITREWSSSRCFAGSWKYASERKTTFSNWGTRSISIPRCPTPTGESVRNHAMQSRLPRREEDEMNCRREPILIQSLGAEGHGETMSSRLLRRSSLWVQNLG